MKIAGVLVALSSFIGTALATAQTTPTFAEIGGLEDRVWAAVAKGDIQAFHNFLMPDMLFVDDHIYTWKDVVDSLPLCHYKSYKLGEIQYRALGPNAVFLAYPVTIDVSCDNKGKQEHTVGTMYATSTWVRKTGNDPWKTQAHTASQIPSEK